MQLSNFSEAQIPKPFFYSLILSGPPTAAQRPFRRAGELKTFFFPLPFGEASFLCNPSPGHLSLLTTLRAREQAWWDITHDPQRLVPDFIAHSRNILLFHPPQPPPPYFLAILKIIRPGKSTRGQLHKPSAKALGKAALAFSARGWERGEIALPARGCCIPTSHEGKSSQEYRRLPSAQQ